MAFASPEHSPQVKALWKTLRSLGCAPTWSTVRLLPAEPINGVSSPTLQSGMPRSASAPGRSRRAVIPADLAERSVRCACNRASSTRRSSWPSSPPAEVDRAPGRRVLPDPRPVRSVHNVATSSCEDPASGLRDDFYDRSTSPPHFMQYHGGRADGHIPERDFQSSGSVMSSLYHLHDMMLGTLLDLAGRRRRSMLLSDHGLHRKSPPPHPRPYPPPRSSHTR